MLKEKGILVFFWNRGCTYQECMHFFQGRSVTGATSVAAHDQAASESASQDGHEVSDIHRHDRNHPVENG
jgi:hypothetical protein